VVPLEGYRFEGLVLVLVAVAALSIVNMAGPQDKTRYELARRIVLYHTLTVEPTLFDRATFGGRSYSDKAPGMSLLAAPVFAGENLVGAARPARAWEAEGDLSLWLVRILTSGVLFLVTTFLLGRLSEGLIPGTGAFTAATFGTATLAAPLAPTLFEHDAATVFAFGGFLLACGARGGRASRLLLAGLCAGTGVVFQYATFIVVAVLAAYCARRGVRELGWFVLGGIPSALVLGGYDWIAFGSPFHLSYRYVANRYAERQHHDFFGIGAPTLDGLRHVLVGNLGLLTLSPVAVAAGAGLWLLWRRGRRAEALIAAVVTIVFVALDAAYFLPYGGDSPGPRFLVPALPFLLLGLPPALERFPTPTLALAAVSAVLTTADAATWSIRPTKDGSWLPSRDEIAKTVWTWLGPDRYGGVAIVLAAAAAALALGTIARWKHGSVDVHA
jgi:hypothetical protein